MDSFEFWLRRTEAKVDRLHLRPSTRLEADDLCDTIKALKRECENRDLPKELLEDEYTEVEMDEEEEERAMDLSSRYNKLLQRLTDDATKAETLSSCWTKLDQDTKELTDALRAGNPGSKFSMEELEDSLAKIKEMLKERSDIINTLTPPVADDY